MGQTWQTAALLGIFGEEARQRELTRLERTEARWRRLTGWLSPTTQPPQFGIRDGGVMARVVWKAFADWPRSLAVDWKALNHQQAMEGLPADLQDEEGSPLPSFRTREFKEDE